MQDTERFIEIALKATKRASRFLMNHFGNVNKIEFKGEINIVTEADRISEAIIIDMIKSNFPDHEILSEESARTGPSSPYLWIIDPLDGTTNYAHGFPFFCISVALQFNGEIIIAVVRNPILNELFIAEKGKGAYLNGKRIRVSQIDKLSKSLLATGFPYDIRTSREDNLNYFCIFSKRAQAVRRAGSAVLDLCYVACGRFDGFWEMKLGPWDIAAGILMVEESGGKVSDFKGNRCSIFNGEIVASNGLIHHEMIETIRMAEEAS